MFTVSLLSIMFALYEADIYLEIFQSSKELQLTNAQKLCSEIFFVSLEWSGRVNRFSYFPRSLMFHHFNKGS